MKKYFLIALLLGTAIACYAQYRMVITQDERYTGHTYTAKRGYITAGSTITAYGQAVSVSFQVVGSTCLFTCNWGDGKNGDAFDANNIAGFSEDFIVPTSSPTKLFFELANGSTIHYHIGYLILTP